jgi:hypothetical protein
VLHNKKIKISEKNNKKIVDLIEMNLGIRWNFTLFISISYFPPFVITKVGSGAN